MSKTNLLIPTILSRRSIRSFEQKPISSEDQERIGQILTAIEPLFPENKFNLELKSRGKNQNLVEVLGAYGHIVSPPYYFVPSINGDKDPLVDLGFRLQQIAVHLWAAGIGSCFIGCLSRESKVKQFFNLNTFARIAAFLVFGYPAKGLEIQSLVEIGKFVKGNSSRKKLEDIFFHGDFEHPGPPPDSLKPVIECGGMSPSAVNAQPWQFLLRGNELILFINCKPKQFLLPENDDYCFHDGGICMANMYMAASSLGNIIRWEMIEKGVEIPTLSHPEYLLPLAKINLKNIQGVSIDHH